jgi:hypothetical protein
MSTTKTNRIEDIKNIANDAWCDVDDAIERLDKSDFTDTLMAERIRDALSGALEKLTSIEELCKLLLEMQGIEVGDE